MMFEKKKYYFTLFLVIIIALFVSCSENYKTSNFSYKSDPVFSPEFIDKSISPGDDFYLYSNAKWLKNISIPDQFSRYGPFEKLEEQNLNQINNLFSELLVNKYEPGSIEEKLSLLYKSGIDSIKINNDGIKPLVDVFTKIDNIKTTAEFTTVLGQLHMSGIYPLFYIYPSADDKNSTIMITQLSQGGISLPDKDYYLSNTPAFITAREKYLQHIFKMFCLSGFDTVQARQNAKTVIVIETFLAQNSLTLIEQKNNPERVYNIFTKDALQKLSPAFDWSNYFESVSINPGRINVRNPDFFVEVNKMINELSTDEWKAYMKWTVLRETAKYLSSDFADEHYYFFTEYLTGASYQLPVKKKVLNYINLLLGEAVGQLYVQNYFSEESRNKVEEMVNSLKSSLRNRILNLEWMSPETKREAIYKLDAMRHKIGYPEKWRSYSELKINQNSYLENIFNINRFNFKWRFSIIDKPVDKKSWTISPQTINAYYSQKTNEIIFPAAMLQPPFFDITADNAVNYGAIGCIIGHEMTHAFDNFGSKYDKNGNRFNWWTDSDFEKYSHTSSLVENAFSDYTISDSLKLNGRLTLGENLADLGGVAVSLNALKNLPLYKNPGKIDGLTQIQRFFLAYSQMWRLKITDRELLRRLREDIHSASEARVNGIVYNFNDFYEAFNINSGKRYISTDKRLKVW